MATLTATDISDSQITSIVMPNHEFIDITDLAARERITDILRRLELIESKRQVEFVELSCRNCGGKIQQKYHDPIFKCPYCKTVYAVGYKQVNSV